MHWKIPDRLDGVKGTDSRLRRTLGAGRPRHRGRCCLYHARTRRAHEPELPGSTRTLVHFGRDIDVRVAPVSKGVQYVERREYRSSSEDSEYHIRLRYNRL